MAPPPVTIYVTSLTSQAKVRKHIELLHRSLKGLEIPYEAFDLAIDEDAKKRWQRAKPAGLVVGLPGYLVGGQWVGTMEDFEDAVETGSLETFLKQDIDLGPGPSGGNSSKTIEEAELEALMRELTNEDLDKLVGELDSGAGGESSLNETLEGERGGRPSVGKVGLLVEAGEEPPVPTSLDPPSKVGQSQSQSTIAPVTAATLNVTGSVAATLLGETLAEREALKKDLSVKETNQPTVKENDQAVHAVPSEDMKGLGGNESVKEGVKVRDEEGVIIESVEKVGKTEENEKDKREKTLDEIFDQVVATEGKEKVD